MEYWNRGVKEEWSDGVMEYGKNAMWEKCRAGLAGVATLRAVKALLQYSITPLLRS